jgi:hypothetical protein
LLRFRLYALVKDSHLAVALFAAEATKNFGNATAAEKRRAIIYLYGSWRLQMDWKPVDLF